MVKVGILGVTGYAGVEVLRLILGHPMAEVTYISSNSYAGQKISDVYKNLANICDIVCEKIDADVIAEKCDVVFTALPHGTAKSVIPSIIEKGVSVVDLSADYRYNDPKVYEKWYNLPHDSVDLLKEAVYGLPELYRDKIKGKRLIGNPGCYTTCSILGTVPLLKSKIAETKNIIIDAKSGVSGAGRGINIDVHFCECTENTKAYKIATHRHTSEIEQELSLAAGEEVLVSFTPHLLPQKRGILATIYANLKKPMETEEVIKVYKEFYKNEKFIRVYESGNLPETNHVAGSNYVDIGIVVDKRLNRVVVVSCIDNLVKGAAGQAVQNMNIMFNLPEDAGLLASPIYL